MYIWRLLVLSVRRLWSHWRATITFDLGFIFVFFLLMLVVPGIS